jgi:hypothetical protein
MSEKFAQPLLWGKKQKNTNEEQMKEIESLKKTVEDARVNSLAEKQYAREAGKKEEQAWTILLQTEQKLQQAQERVKELERPNYIFHGRSWIVGRAYCNLGLAFFRSSSGP